MDMTSPKSDKASTEFPPNQVAAKVSKGGPNAVTAENLKNLDENIVASLGGQYLEWVEADLVKLDASLAKIETSDTIESASVRDFRKIVHDIRGMGGTFEFDLVTTIADQVHSLVHAFESFGPEQVVALQVHVGALKVVVAERLKGEGGRRGREVLDGLQKVYDKYV